MMTSCVVIYSDELGQMDRASLRATAIAWHSGRVLLRHRPGTTTDARAGRAGYDWKAHARPNQMPPASPWRIWLVRAGRGFGKTRTGSEWVRAQMESGRCRRMALVGRTAADTRDVMVEGPAGILAVSPPETRPVYEPSKRRLTWPNGGQAFCYSAEEPDRLRGP